jgi:membrane protein DedA with SNARE-associated domain
MSIDITYIAVAAVAMLLGLYVGLKLGRHFGRNHVLRVGLAVKNPEMWELLHYLIIDDAVKESETKSYRRRPPN